MNLKKREKLEQRAILFSILGAMLFAALGLSYGLYTHSQSILFDGIYSCISLVMSLATLWVSKLVIRPDDENFQFGYTHLEPLLNVIKAIIISATCLYALTEAVSTLLDGGRRIALGAAMTYASISTLGSLSFGVVIYYLAKKSDSKLAAIDATDWLFDGLLSAGILIGFSVAYAIKDGPYGHLVNYLDPLLVIVLVLLFMPIPLRIFRNNIREVLYLAPSTKVQTQVDEGVRRALSAAGLSQYHLRMAKIGREFNLSVYVIVDADYRVERVAQLDGVRQSIAAELAPIDTQSSRLWLDVLFTEDEKWVFD